MENMKTYAFIQGAVKAAKKRTPSEQTPGVARKGGKLTIPSKKPKSIH